MSSFSIRKIISIATLTVKQAVRSRLLPALAVALPAIAVLIILTIKGDGTTAGQISIAIKYSFAIILMLLAVSTLWSGCASISREIEDKQIRLIAVKPTHKHEIWFGRWIGWIAINAILLTICGITITTAVHYKLNSQNLSAATKTTVQNSILVGRHRILPQPDKISNEKIQPLIKKLKNSGEIAADASDDDACNLIHKRVIAARSVVAPSAKKTWFMSMPKTIATGKQVSLKIKILSPSRTERTASGELTIATEDNPTLNIFETRIENKHDGTQLINIPSGVLQGGENILITFQNDSSDNSHTLIFPPNKSLEILISATSFTNNLIRAMLIALSFLSLLSALGLTTSSIFSFPVATFIAVAIIMAAITSNYFVFASDPANAVEHHHHGHEHEPPAEPGIVIKSGEFLLNKLQFVFSPIKQGDILQDLSSGILISWHDTIRAIIMILLVYSGILGMLGSYILSKRELAALN